MPQRTDGSGFGASNAIVTSTARHWLDDEGILHVVGLPGSAHTLADARENVGVDGRIAKGGKAPTVIDMRLIESISRDARNYYGGPEAAAIYAAAALIADSPLSRILATFFLGINKPLIPTRLVEGEEAAVAWLRQFLPRDEPR